mgnify:CR=1 FL=1
MLRKLKGRSATAVGGRFAVVASRYNQRYVHSMVRAATAELQRRGAKHIRIVRVPGAFEIPAVAASLARQRTPGWDAIICLGVILRGETAHADLIGQSVSHALGLLQVETGLPIIHEVLLLDNRQQARVRCLDPDHNRGREAAQTALVMSEVMVKVRRGGGPGGR